MSSSNFKRRDFYYELKLFLNFYMIVKRTLNVHKTLKYVKDLEVSSSDKSDFEDEFVSEGRLIIVLPS